MHTSRAFLIHINNVEDVKTVFWKFSFRRVSRVGPVASAWATTGMSKGGEHLAPQKCYKVFCALVVTIKRLIDQLFMHHFHNFSPPGFHLWTPLGDFSTPHNLPTPGKNPAGAHAGRVFCSWSTGQIGSQKILLGPNSQTIFWQSCDNFWTCDNLMTIVKFTKHLWQS